MNSLDLFASAKLAALQAESLRRELTTTERLGDARVVRRGRSLVSFSCNDYLGLSHDPRLKAAAVEAIERYGTGAGASRLVTGDHPALRDLEEALARRKDTEAALVFGSGYLANLGVPPALVGEGDLVVLDELSHACMFAGARLSRARALTYRHNDMADLVGLLERERGRAARALILTETVFSMDGDLAPLAELAEAAERFDAWLMTDDAHGLGLVAPQTRAPLQMGTLSKALGGYGGYLCASRPVVDLMKSRARTLVYATGLPPACAASALAALRIIEREPERGARALALARRFARALGLPEAQSAIVPVLVGDAQDALRLSADLERRGMLVVAIRPPTVPAGTARLRVAFSAAHEEAQVDQLAAALAEARVPIRMGAA